MIGEPQRTAYDWNFALGDFPVRVHPFFWLTALLMGAQAKGGREILAWVACVFVSILIHELGHAVIARINGARPWIVLHGLGGLCVHEKGRLSSGQRLTELACGPFAGFLFGGLIAGLFYLFLGAKPIEVLGLFTGGEELDSLRSAFGGRPLLFFVYFQLLYINFAWGLVNLLPIYPLDGGQMTPILLSASRARNPQKTTHIVSIVVAGALALWGFLQKNQYLGIMMVILAILNFQYYQALAHSYGYEENDPADWWKSKR